MDATSPESKFTILATTSEDRKKFPSDFVLVLPQELADAYELHADERVVIGRQLDQPDLRMLYVAASLRIDTVAPPKAETASNRCIRMDQTLRTALGYQYTDKDVKEDNARLVFSPLPWVQKNKLKRRFLRFLGVKYTFARVEKPHPTDIEKGLCRISKDTLSIIGTDEGRKIVVESCFAPSGSDTKEFQNTEHAIRAFDLGKDIRDQRAIEKTKGAEERWQARYINAEGLLGVTPDISPIYLDKAARDALGGVRPGDAVRVRRDFVDLYKSQAFEFGVVTALSAPIGRLLPDAWRADRFITWLAVTLLLSATIALLLVWVRLRARVH